MTSPQRYTSRPTVNRDENEVKKYSAKMRHICEARDVVTLFEGLGLDVWLCAAELLFAVCSSDDIHEVSTKPETLCSNPFTSRIDYVRDCPIGLSQTNLSILRWLLTTVHDYYGLLQGSRPSGRYCMR